MPLRLGEGDVLIINRFYKMIENPLDKYQEKLV
jgi:hypothetical protein